MINELYNAIRQVLENTENKEIKDDSIRISLAKSGDIDFHINGDLIMYIKDNSMNYISDNILQKVEVEVEKEVIKEVEVEKPNKELELLLKLLENRDLIIHNK